MSEQDGPATLGELDDDELFDVLDAGDDDLDDGAAGLDEDVLDLGGDVIVRQFVPEPVDDGGGFDVAGDELLGAAVPVAAAMPEDRLARLEATARALAKAEHERETGRVHRKVTAATTGAGAIGFIPILLQLVGAVDLGPELAATASTAAAILGAFGAGWVTPERTGTVSSIRAAQDLLDEEL